MGIMITKADFWDEICKHTEKLAKMQETVLPMDANDFVCPVCLDVMSHTAPRTKYMPPLCYCDYEDY